MKFDINKSSFDEIKKIMPSGKVNGDTKLEIYWMNAVDGEDASFLQATERHHHNFFEIHFVLRGKMIYEVGENTVTLTEGMCIVFIPTQSHRIEYYSSDFLKCSLSFLLGEDEAIYERLVLKNGHPIIFGDAIYESIRYICEKSRQDTPYYDILLKNRMFEIIHTLAGKMDGKKAKNASLPTEQRDIRLFKAKQFIIDNPHVFIGCEDIAAYCGISSKQLSRIFMREEGMSLLAYIHKCKIDEAERMLAENKFSTREIGENLGFSSVYYFSRFFMKHAGMTPAEYRKSKEKEN